jgi:predicted GNAT superfamily acetyltransferase
VCLCWERVTTAVLHVYHHCMLLALADSVVAVVVVAVAVVVAAAHGYPRVRCEVCVPQQQHTMQAIHASSGYISNRENEHQTQAQRAAHMY